VLTRRSIPNLLTGLRLVLVPVLWVAALVGRDVVVGAGLALAWLTDALDGFLARRLNAQTEWGSRFDSIADLLMFASALVWLVILRPDFVRDHAVLLGTWIGLGTTAYLVGWLRFRRVADLHLYSAKAANFVGFLFVAYLFAFGEYPLLLFHGVIGICILAAAETLVALATCTRVDEHMVTVLPGLRRRASASG
jgi:phosphatidylglycerophosphate synthase